MLILQYYIHDGDLFLRSVLINTKTMFPPTCTHLKQNSIHKFINPNQTVHREQKMQLKLCLKDRGVGEIDFIMQESQNSNLTLDR